MTSRRIAATSIVAAILIALVLGSVGSAAGSALTAKTVKKIATKVVKKQAVGLSVAHAAAAGDAATVGGATAAQLRTTGYRYSLTAGAVSTSQTWSFPSLPPGTYLAAYTVQVTSSAPGSSVRCKLSPTGGVSAAVGSEALADGGGFSFLSASGVTSTNGLVALNCTETGASVLGVLASEHTITFVPVDSLAVNTTVPAT